MPIEDPTEDLLATKITGKVLTAVSYGSDSTTVSFQDGARLVAWTSLRVDGLIKFGFSAIRSTTRIEEEIILEFDEGRIAVSVLPKSGPEAVLFEDNDGTVIVEN